MMKKNKKKRLQNNPQHILCETEKYIPKGIISYYSLVYLLNSAFSDKKVFDDFSFFFFLKKNELAKCLFFSCPTCPVVPYSHLEGLKGHFLGQLAGQLGQQLTLKNHNYSQTKLSPPQNQESGKYGQEYYRQKPP
jgi:hypothetical protein